MQAFCCSRALVYSPPFNHSRVNCPLCLFNLTTVISKVALARSLLDLCSVATILLPILVWTNQFVTPRGSSWECTCSTEILKSSAIRANKTWRALDDVEDVFLNVSGFLYFWGLSDSTSTWNNSVVPDGFTRVWTPKICSPRIQIFAIKIWSDIRE